MVDRVVGPADLKAPDGSLREQMRRLQLTPHTPTGTFTHTCWRAGVSQPSRTAGSDFSIYTSKILPIVQLYIVNDQMFHLPCLHQFFMFLYDTSWVKNDIGTEIHNMIIHYDFTNA